MTSPIASRTLASSRPAPRRTRWRRATACVLVGVFAFLFLAPSLEGAAAARDGRCCQRGVCCHHRKAADKTCLRGLCPCGGHERGTPTAPIQFDATLPGAVELRANAAVGGSPCAATAAHLTLDPTPPHGPPRLSL